MDKLYLQNLCLQIIKGAIKIISYHKDSLSKALMDLFPNIGLDKMHLWYKSTKYFCLSGYLSLCVILFLALCLFFLFMANFLLRLIRNLE